ncbi:MAG: hypothetical protein WCS70_11415 [Verrucomicrobiota bacterium]
MKLRLLLLVVLTLLRATGTFAQQTNSPPDPRRLFESAVELQAEAGRSTNPANRAALLQRAMEMYSATVRVKSDYSDAWLGRGQCLVSLASLSDQPEQRRQYLARAIQDFTTATQLPAADWHAHYGLANLYMQESQLLGDSSAQTRGVLEQARASYQRAIALAKFKSREAQTEAELAVCLTTLAKQTPDPTAQRALWEEANQRFTRGGTDLMVSSTARFMNLWGVTLIEMGKLTQDQNYYRQAIEKLTAALELEPGDLSTTYNLACQYSLTGQTDEALFQLSRCYGDTRQGAYFRTVSEQDPDLAPVRRTAGYAMLTKPAQDQSPASVNVVRKRGEQLLSEAQANPAGADSWGKLQAAAAAFEQLVTLQPGRAEPLVLQATGEQMLATQTPDPKSRRALLESARQHLSAATACRDVQPGHWRQRGQLLLMNLDFLAQAPAAQKQLLNEAQTHLEQALQSATTISDRTATESALGMLSNQLGQQATASTGKQLYYTQAITHLEAAIRGDVEAKRASNYQQLGLALLRLYQLDRDKMKAHSAIERLDTALKMAPGDLPITYTLVQACAIAGQPSQAIRQLQTCFEVDPGNVYRQRAMTDPDLESLRQLPEFQALNGATTSEPAPLSLPTPRISDR